LCESTVVGRSHTVVTPRRLDRQLAGNDLNTTLDALGRVAQILRAR
jgi:hypothetical protein